MRFVSLAHRLGLALCVSAFSLSAQATPTNAGFEAGDFSSWTISDSDLNFVVAEFGRDASFGAVLGSSYGEGTLSQSLATVAGHHYELAFWLSNLGGAVDNSDTVASFNAFFDGAAPVFTLADKTTTDYTRYTAAFTAGADSAVLNFAFRHDETFWLLDDVSFTDLDAVPDPGSNVPEPGTLVMLGTSLALLAAARRRRG